MFAVIMAGGEGTRFWPRSRRQRPKHLLSFGDADTLMQQTLKRIRPLIPPQRTYIVAARQHLEALRAQIPRFPQDHLLLEPVGRNTAACIGLAAITIRQRHPGQEGVMVVMPADHHIAGQAAYLKALSTAALLVSRPQWQGRLVTLGITPTRPETGYGYIRMGEVMTRLNRQPIYRVMRFIEKPPLGVAKRLLSRGDYLWNSGVFIWRVDTILERIATHLPELHAGLNRLADALGTPRATRVLEQVYTRIPSISIDHGVLEKDRSLLVVPCRCHWSDVGSWGALAELLPADSHGNVVVGRHLGVGSQGMIIHAPNRLVATVGLKGMIIIDTPDALLVCPRQQDQAIRQVVEALKRAGLEEYL